MTDTAQGPDTGPDPRVGDPRLLKNAVRYLKSLSLTTRIVIGVVVAAAVLTGTYAAVSGSRGCPVGTYKDVSYITGNTFCGPIAPHSATPTTAARPGATQAQISQGCPVYETEAACSSALSAQSSSTTTTPPLTDPTPNYVGMSVTAAEDAPSTDNGWTVSGANETCDGGATDYIVSQSPAAGTVETADGLGDFGNVELVGSCPD